MAYQNINQYNFPKWYMLNRSDIMDFCLASDERDYKEEVIFSPYIIGNTDGNVLPVKIDLNSPDNSELFVLDYDVYNPFNILVSSNYYNPDDLDLSCFSGFSALCDVGLTGIDNGLVREMTGQTAYITKGINDFTKFDRLSYDRRMKFFQVTGYTQPPNIRFSGIPKNDNYSVVSYQKDAGVYHELYGGFYQGFYKLYGYDYEVLPERAHHGWSAEFLLRPRIWDDYFPTPEDTTLNDVYPNNAGIFFYMGARAENKFYHYASGSPSGFTAYTRVTESLVSSQTYGTTGETTCVLTCGCSDTGNTMSHCGPVYPPQNYITNVTPCETSQVTAPELNPSGDSCSNNFAVKFSGDPGNPKICVRVLRLTDECSIDQCTSAKTYTSGCTVQEYCTPKGINYFCENTDYIKFEHWTQVDVVFERYRDMDECHLWWDGGLGVLTNFKYTASTYNESVTLIQPPYTHINVQSGDTTPIETPYGREIVELNNKWLQQKDYRLGRLKIYVNGRRFHTFENFEEVIPRPLDTEREKQIGVPFNLSWGGGTQGLRENLTFKDCPTDSGNIYQQDPELFPDSVLSGTSLSGLNTNILLEKYFAGTFDGGISQFNYYIKPMTADEVKHNYKLNKTRYDLFDWDCPNCDVLVPECNLSAVVYEYTTTTTTIPTTTTTTVPITTTTTTVPLCDITYDIVPLPECLEYFETDDGFYLITEDGNFIITENDPCCFDNLLDENGDIMITENGQYLIFDNGNCVSLTLDAYYNPGSVVIDYVLLSSSNAPDNVSVSFTNTLGVFSGNPINVNSTVTILSGDTSGNTQVTLPNNFNNLDGSSIFTNTSVSQSGGTFYFNVTKNPIFPQPTPTPTPTPTATVTPTPTITTTPTPTPTPTSTVTPTPTPTNTPTPTLTPTPTNSIPPLYSTRYLRWTLLKKKGTDDVAIQVSDLVLLSNGSESLWNINATATSPDSTYAAPYETAQNLVDNNIGSKYCNISFGFGPVGTATIYMDNTVNIGFDSYYYNTGNDVPARDPVSWTLEISDDNINWVLIDTVTNATITNDRQSATQIFNIPPPPSPTPTPTPTPTVTPTDIGCGSLVFSLIPPDTYTADQSLIVPVSGVLDLTNTTTFTVESWIYPKSSLGNQITIFGDTAGYTNWWSFTFNTNDNTLRLYWIDNLGGHTITGYDASQTIPLSAWTHVAVSVNTGTIKLFINGTELGLTGDVIPFIGADGSTSQLQVGNWVDNGSNNFNLKGNLSNLRVNNTTALYTSGFTPSYPLTSVSGTSLLLLTDGNSPTFDSSGNNVSVTNNNNVTWEEKCVIIPSPTPTPTNTETSTPTPTPTPTTTLIPPSIVTDGLVLYYDFSDPISYSGSGSNIIDLSTSNNDGTVVNSYGHISYVSSGSTSYFNWDSNSGGNGGSNSFSGSIWTTSANTYLDFTMILQPDFSMGGIGGMFCLPNDKSLRVYNGGWEFPNPGNGDDWASSPTNFYVNGQVSNQMVSGWNIIGGVKNNNSPAFPNNGVLYVGTSGYSGRNMQGKIAVVLMYNRALTGQEQIQNYNFFKTRFGL